ncbi:alpha-(1,6)-fucosyltransferase-like [Mercenaria mercenaria]|uniref:alpha-(1,6)-fucosyltransferase-like n=1 Tax=Mercenaria mercenaria TaxID=6596 RepID=UPI00234F4B26|nr:alpha-(1,6)-fucosyltransferase-like [Mercenaria mercenaria]
MQQKPAFIRPVDLPPGPQSLVSPNTITNAFFDAHLLAEDALSLFGRLVQPPLGDLEAFLETGVDKNPRDCTKAKKLVCKMDKVCGFGCQLNHVTYCLIMAYGTQRTLILDSKEWHYAPEEGWESVFLPVSTNCTSTMGQRALHWNGKTDYSVIKLPFIDRLSPRPDFLPFALPLDISDRIERFHGEPAAWWIGQFVKYLTRPNAKLNKYFQERMRMLGFAKPIVGVQIRRTDKITRREAVFHDLDEYMNHVKEWFDVYERSHSNVQRRVYLATDEPTILSDAVQKYPDYKFISDNEVSKSAGMNSRYTNTSLRGILLDVHLLSMCNYLVCTFSSQVCRSAYERMQPRYGDASGCFRSLDDSYHFFGQNPRYWKAVIQHKARDADEISFEKGDFVNVAGNHWNGYSKGTHIKTNKEGLFPTYKIKSELTRVAVPTYPEVEIGAGNWNLRK